ncbi:hypothetical protein FBU30_009780 [Linnemannia zychae]|nr:hypothetical protein FBU30_009780 [Linnemannia zychae]
MSRPNPKSLTLCTLPAELCAQIVIHLRNPDLSSLSRVSKAWRQTCLSLLWKDIQILTEHQRDSFISKETAAALACYGCYTQSFKTRYPECLLSFMEIEQVFEKDALTVGDNESKRIQLERFDLLLLQDNFFTDTTENTTDATNVRIQSADVVDTTGRTVVLTNQAHNILLNKFLQSSICCSTLRTLRIYRVPYDPTRLLKTIATYLPGLQILYLFTGGGIPYRRMPCLGPETVRLFPENCPSTLRELAFGVKIKGDHPPELCSMSTNQELVRRTRTHPELKILSLPGSMNGYEEEVLVAGEGGFLQGCSELELIESPNNPLDGVISQHQQILVNSRHLRSLEIRHSDLESNVTRGLLPQTHELDTIRARLLATDIITSTLSWGCLLLTTLQIEIGGIPRAGECDPLDKEKSHWIQRRVYRQLGSLVHLQELRLGRACERLDIEDYEAQRQLYSQRQQSQQQQQINEDNKNGSIPGFQQDCLEMSLESDLDLLSNLTELSILDLSRMNHRVGQPELHWMLSHWPNLHTLYGVKM